MKTRIKTTRLFIKTVRQDCSTQDCSSRLFISLRMFVKTVQNKAVRQDCKLRMFVKTVRVVIDDDQKWI